MADCDDLLSALERGQLYSFCDWPNRAVPQLAAGVYTIWRHDDLIYVGMAGRSLTPEHVAAGRDASKRGGLFSRLSSHAAGRRSGDQFCVYVADRLVLPALSNDDLAEIGNGRHSLDRLVRNYIHTHLSYRFVVVGGGAEARELESRVRRGALQAGRPWLNPSKAKARVTKAADMGTNLVPVLAAVISRNGSILIARRPRHKRHGGLWEFPGGKILPGESLFDAARREVDEELGMRVERVGRILFEQQDPGSLFLIRFIEVEAEGDAKPSEHEGVAWVAPHELGQYALAPTDSIFASILTASK